MFTSKNIVLWISKSKLTVLELADNGKVSTLDSQLWNSKNFSTVIQSLIQKHSIDSILIDEDYVYSIDLSKKEIQNVHDEIFRKAAELIPEELEKVPAGYTEQPDYFRFYAINSFIARSLQTALSGSKQKFFPIILYQLISQVNDQTVADAEIWKNLAKKIKEKSNILNIEVESQEKIKKTETQSEQKLIEKTDKDTHASARKKPMITVLLVILVMSAALFAGVAYWDYFFREKSTPESKIDAVQPTEITPPTGKTQLPTPTPDRQDYTILVLNGSGTTGAATDVEDLLDKNNFKVVETGNADNFDYKETVISAKKTVPVSIVKSIDKLLQNNYSVDIDESSSPTEDVDIKIIIGTKNENP